MRTRTVITIVLEEDREWDSEVSVNDINNAYEEDFGSLHASDMKLLEVHTRELETDEDLIQSTVLANLAVTHR